MWLDDRGPGLIFQPRNYQLIAESLPEIWMRRALERRDSGFSISTRWSAPERTCQLSCSGGPCGDRTHDTRIKSPVLCQLS